VSCGEAPAAADLLQQLDGHLERHELNLPDGPAAQLSLLLTKGTDGRTEGNHTIVPSAPRCVCGVLRTISRDCSESLGHTMAPGSYLIVVQVVRANYQASFPPALLSKVHSDVPCFLTQCHKSIMGCLGGQMLKALKEEE